MLNLIVSADMMVICWLMWLCCFVQHVSNMLADVLADAFANVLLGSDSLPYTQYDIDNMTLKILTSQRRLSQVLR